jgi:F-type H+-transporting ATPase subunit gamma
VPTLEALRRRIATVEDLRSVVRTMKSLAAVSIRQYEDAVAAVAQYQRTVELALRVALAGREAAPPAEDGSTLAVIFGSEHGLCGRFNEEVARLLRETRQAAKPAGPWTLLAIGAQAAARLEASGEVVESRLTLPSSVDGLTRTAESILLAIDRWRGARRTGRVLLFYNGRSDETGVRPGMTALLPVDLDRFRGERAGRWPSRRLPTFTMDAERLMAASLRQYLFVRVYRAGAESGASEHASRLAAMQAAQRNIDERLDEMAQSFRQIRQESITEELMDVVAGFETITTDEGDGDLGAADDLIVA